MQVTCGKCGLVYRDEDCWTICPHRVLDSAPDAPYYNCGNGGYCTGHDLFNCTMERPAEPPEGTREVGTYYKDGVHSAVFPEMGAIRDADAEG
jgi:hypothetical protein